MKVLYIGHYHESSGWGEAGRNWIRALNSAGVDIVPRPIILSGGAEISDEIKELEKKSQLGCTHVIQHVLPQYMVSSSLQNIGMFIWETSTTPVDWIKYLTLVDKVWVANPAMKYSVKRSTGLESTVIPHAFDLDDWHDEKFDTPEFDDFIFYTIGETNPRKNFGATIRAFHAEFSPHEPVRLLIKTSSPDMSPEQTREVFDKDAAKIKMDTRLYDDISKFKQDILITERLSRHDLIKLHNSCDCYVSTSHGEACNIPLWEATLHGKDSIGVNNSGEYIATHSVDANEQCCYRWNTVDNYATSRDYWLVPNERAVRGFMRDIYEKRNQVNDKRNIVWANNAQQYSIESIGRLMKESLLK